MYTECSFYSVWSEYHDQLLVEFSHMTQSQSQSLAVKCHTAAHWYNLVTFFPQVCMWLLENHRYSRPLTQWTEYGPLSLHSFHHLESDPLWLVMLCTVTSSVSLLLVMLEEGGAVGNLWHCCSDSSLSRTRSAHWYVPLHMTWCQLPWSLESLGWHYCSANRSVIWWRCVPQWSH